MSLNIFEKDYDHESLYDLARDIDECFDRRLNPVIVEIPKGEYGFCKGTFTVRIIWEDEE